MDTTKPNGGGQAGMGVTGGAGGGGVVGSTTGGGGAAGRRARRRRAAAAAAARQAAVAVESRASALAAIRQFSGVGWEGAGYSHRRGYVYWPTLDTKKELTRYTRRELLAKSRWLRANFGLANRICGGLADLIGYLTPQAMTADEAWNDEAEELFADRAGQPGVIDAAGKYDYRQLQMELNKAALGDGDILPVWTDSEGGGLMVALYEAQQLASPPVDDGTGEPKGWHDGVKINRFGRHVAYRVAAPDDPASGLVINARDAAYYAHWDAPGRVRPPTVLAHAINHMVDISEILADTKMAVKIAAQIGLYLRNAPGGGAGAMGARAMFSGLRDETASDGDSTTSDPVLKYDDVITAGGSIPNLPDGTDIGVIRDERPHPNQLALMEYLVRDIAWGVGVAPEILWDISSLRGANNRLVNADLQRWIGAKQLRLRGWMRRMWVVWCAKEMAAGRLRQPRDPRWWAVTFLPQASLTADKGREGKLNIELVAANMRSLATHFAEEGKDWRAELMQIGKERRMLAELGLAMADLKPAAPGEDEADSGDDQSGGRRGGRDPDGEDLEDDRDPDDEDADDDMAAGPDRDDDDEI